MTPSTENNPGSGRAVDELTDDYVRQWVPDWDREEVWKKLEARIDERVQVGSRPAPQSAETSDVLDDRYRKERTSRYFFYNIGMAAAATLILGLDAMNANAVMKLCTRLVVPTWEQMQAKRDREEYLKTRPWYEQAAGKWADFSKTTGKGVSKALGADKGAARDMKRQMDSLGIDNTLDYYKWLKTQKRKH